MQKTLHLNPEKCTGCLQCEMACSFENYATYAPSKSRIKVFDFHHTGRKVPYTCTQCDEAWCLHACPVEAITIDHLTGAKVVNETTASAARSARSAAPSARSTTSRRLARSRSATFAAASRPAPPPPPPAGSLQVLPATFDFGKVTSGNTPAPLEVTIANTSTGTAQVSVSSISLLAPTGSPFALNVNGGSWPCGSGSPTLAAATSCTVQVAFNATSDATFTSTLQVDSNASNGRVSVGISGTSEAAKTWTLRINQIDADVAACPVATAYVSVVDQGGFPVTNLLKDNFTVVQGSPILNFTVSLAGTTSPVGIAAALDHSASLTQQPVAFAT